MSPIRTKPVSSTPRAAALAVAEKRTGAAATRPIACRRVMFATVLMLLFPAPFAVIDRNAPARREDAVLFDTRPLASNGTKQQSRHVAANLRLEFGEQL